MSAVQAAMFPGGELIFEWVNHILKEEAILAFRASW